MLVGKCNTLIIDWMIKFQVIIVSIFLLVNLPQALFMAMLCVYNTLNIPTRFLEGMFPVTFLLVSNMLVMVM